MSTSLVVRSFAERAVTLANQICWANAQHSAYPNPSGITETHHLFTDGLARPKHFLGLSVISGPSDTPKLPDTVVVYVAGLSNRTIMDRLTSRQPATQHAVGYTCINETAFMPDATVSRSIAATSMVAGLPPLITELDTDDLNSELAVQEVTSALTFGYDILDHIGAAHRNRTQATPSGYIGTPFKF
jgi:hypothetical protein